MLGKNNPMLTIFKLGSQQTKIDLVVIKWFAPSESQLHCVFKNSPSDHQCILLEEKLGGCQVLC
jgi:hypothetical protein